MDDALEPSSIITLRYDVLPEKLFEKAVYDSVRCI